MAHLIPPQIKIEGGTERRDISETIPGVMPHLLLNLFISILDF